MIGRALSGWLDRLVAPRPALPAGGDPLLTPPVVTLDIGSRYAKGSRNRSALDVRADAAVTAALKPIDDFIEALARQTDILHHPATAPDAGEAAAAKVLAAIRRWAEAGALGRLTTMGGNLGAPPRIGAIAFAFAPARARLPLAPENARIEAWLRARAGQTIAYQETAAPKTAKANNHRAWAGLAVTRIGLLLQDPALIDWGAGSATVVAASAAPDGSLPLEMWRGPRALHYQLHALTPLVVTAALLADTRPGLFDANDRAIPRAARFTVDALEDPSLVERITGERQTIGGPDSPPDEFQFAWVHAFLRHTHDPKIEAFAARASDVFYPRLGGDQALLWPRS